MVRDEFKLAVFMLAFTFLAIGLASVSYAGTPATELYSDQNESVEVDYGNWSQLDQTFGAVYYDNETVENFQGQTLAEGTDYQYEPNNTSITFYDTSKTTDGETAYVDYPFLARPAMIRQAVQTFGGIFRILGVVGGMGLMAFGLLSAVNRLRNARGR